MKLKKIKPLFTKILTTSDKYIEDDLKTNGLIDISKIKKGLKEYQTIVSVGTGVRFVKEGDVVCINPRRYAVPKYKKDSMKEAMEEYTQEYSYNFPVVNINNEDLLLLDEGDIEFICEEFDK